MGEEYVKLLADIYGISIPSVKRLVNIFLKAVDTTPSKLLSIDLLHTTPHARAKADQDWESLSGASGAMYGYIAPIDGWLCTTQCPYDSPNPSDCFNGHYQTRGLNAQEMRDDDLRIIFICVAGPGKMNDARAYRRLVGYRL